MSEEELAGALRRLSQVTERSRERAARRERMWEQLSGVTATEAGAGGAVRVTVGAGGELVGLDLADSVRSLPGAVLSTQIMAAVRRAQATLARQVAALAADPATEPDPMVAGIVARYQNQFPEQPADTGPPPLPQAPRHTTPPPPMAAPMAAPMAQPAMASPRTAQPRMAPSRSAPPHRAPRAPVPPRPGYEDDEDFSQDTFLRRH